MCVKETKHCGGRDYRFYGRCRNLDEVLLSELSPTERKKKYDYCLLSSHHGYKSNWSCERKTTERKKGRNLLQIVDPWVQVEFSIKDLQTAERKRTHRRVLGHFIDLFKHRNTTWEKEDLCNIKGGCLLNIKCQRPFDPISIANSFTLQTAGPYV